MGTREELVVVVVAGGCAFIDPPLSLLLGCWAAALSSCGVYGRKCQLHHEVMASNAQSKKKKKLNYLFPSPPFLFSSGG